VIRPARWRAQCAAHFKHRLYLRRREDFNFFAVGGRRVDQIGNVLVHGAPLPRMLEHAEDDTMQMQLAPAGETGFGHGRIGALEVGRAELLQLDQATAGQEVLAQQLVVALEGLGRDIGLGFGRKPVIDEVADGLIAGIDVCALGDTGEKDRGLPLRFRLGACLERDAFNLPRAGCRINTEVVLEPPALTAPF
jgi:hypothetical protein